MEGAGMGAWSRGGQGMGERVRIPPWRAEGRRGRRGGAGRGSARGSAAGPSNSTREEKWGEEKNQEEDGEKNEPRARAKLYFRMVQTG